MTQIEVGTIMVSQSDWPTMKEATEMLDALGVPYETKIVSALRTPDRHWYYGKTAASRGLKVIIAGAGGVLLRTVTSHRALVATAARGSVLFRTVQSDSRGVLRRHSTDASA